MKAAVYINENPFWLDVLERLETEGVSGACVIGSPVGVGTFASDVRRQFPKACYLDHYALNRGECSEKGWENHALDFDAAARFVWEKKGHEIIELMSRMDTRDEFSYRGRRDLLHRYLKLSDFLQKKYDLTALVASLIPHDPFLYVFASLLRARGARIASFSYTNYDGRIIPFGDGEWIYRAKLLKTYQGFLADGRTTSNVPEAMRADFARIRGPGKDAAPADFKYVNTWLTTLWHTNPRNLLLHWVGSVARDASDLAGARRERGRPFPTRYEKEPGRSIENSFVGHLARLRHEYWTLGNLALQRRLKKAYAGVARPAPSSEPFVFVPLHYQPELTTLPLGGAFSNQILMLEALSASIPDDWQIAVKEHPSQFNPSFSFSYQGRRPEDYALMAAIPKVALVPISHDQFDLMDRSLAVATVTGTAGWEGLLRGKPVLVFGNAWYSGCAGAHQITDTTACRAAVEKIIRGERHAEVEPELFAEAIEMTGAVPYVGKDGDWKPWVISGLKEEDRQLALARHVELILEMLAVPLGGDDSSSCAASEAVGTGTSACAS